VVHLSLGTVDDPAHPERFRAGVRRAMRVVGERRCVVWPNMWRPVVTGPGWDVLNAVLAQEAARRANLIVVDWAGIVAQHQDWLSKVDATHVSEAGYRARARAVASAVRECYRRLE
jgi:lysophospholipase L1-like esterase